MTVPPTGPTATQLRTRVLTQLLHTGAVTSEELAEAYWRKGADGPPRDPGKPKS